ncbi:MAG: c-type cytochrome [Nitrospinae bacterium]|nr:c-type cytochrome [Nitrospinota bacterium]
MAEEEKKPDFKEGEFDEHTSYSFLFFLVSGLALFVTLWAFWDDEYARRGFKAYQEQYFKEQFAIAEGEWKAVNAEIAVTEKQIRENLAKKTGELEASDNYQQLVEEVRLKQIAVDEAKEQKKFAGSRVDEAYYYYKKAMHEGENYDVQKATLHSLQDKVEEYKPIIDERQKILEEAENRLLKVKVDQLKFEKDLANLTRQKSQLELTMDYYKPFPFFWRPAEILQTVIPGFGKNSFKEIIYRVDRCMTCHISYQDEHYKDFEQPLKTHPNLDVLIKKHPPERTGCTWCHLGQGSATAPAEHAHGSHHETDQTVEVNEPILHGIFQQATCRNCHAEVVNLDGAPLLSKGKRLFLKLGCHGCHLADGYANEGKVGPRLYRIASKVDPSWLYRWIKKPKGYLPNTRMPEFGFNEKDLMGVTAYLLAASDKNYKLGKKFESGDPDKGKKLFESVGCQGCHALNGQGESFAPDLSRIGNKVNADWLVTWIGSPHSYNAKSKMPDLRLNGEQASDIASYLMQFGKKEVIPGLEAKLKDPDVIKHGETVVRRRGCFACHDIKGMEKEGRIAPELSAFGRKMLMELEFGDSHIPHTWESWAKTKLKKPDTFRTERVLDKMPNFHLAPDEIDALVVLLKGFNGTKVPNKYRKILSEKEKIIETGRRLITKYNCKACHNVEGEGGRIQKYLKAKAQYPPPLDMGDYHVGERIKSSWLYSFLKEPTPVRTWIKVKMPTFSFSDKEVADLTAYFNALSPDNVSYEAGVHREKDGAIAQKGAEMVTYMDCGRCHDDGQKGIEFSIASKRLKQNWIPKWLKDTRAMIPWTPMPSHWVKNGNQYKVPTKFSEINSVGDVDTQVNTLKDLIVAYNTAELDFDVSLGEDEGGDDEEGDEEGGDEEDEEEEE